MRFSIKTIFTVTLFAAFAFSIWRVQHDRMLARNNAVQQLLAAPDPLGLDFNPVELVRAVNQLHSLGSPEALFVLKQFCNDHPNDGFGSKHQSIELVVPFTFVPENVQNKLPEPDYGGNFPMAYRLVLDNWRHRVVVQDGLPLHTVYVRGASGLSGDQTYLIEWAEEHGRLRDTPMTPTNDPFRAVNKLIAKMNASSLGESREISKWTIRHLRMQAYRSVANIPGIVDDDNSLAPYDDERWANLVNVADHLGIFWDVRCQCYMATNDARSE